MSIKQVCPLLIGVFLGVVGSASAQSSTRGTDVQHYGFFIRLNDSTDKISARAEVTVRFLRATRYFDLDLEGPGGDSGMTVRSVKEEGADLPFTQAGGKLKIDAHPAAGTEHTYTIQYGGIPRDGLIISTNKFGRRTFFGDNWPDRAHQWLPCVDHPSDKATVDFTVTVPDHYQVVANGEKVEETSLGNHLTRSHWTESVAIPTYCMVIGVADFAIAHVATVTGIPVYSYVFPENRDRGFQAYSVAAGILPFYVRKIGPYPYEKLADIQSKTIYGGMENASAIFYYENSVDARDVEELMAHEIAHQWFGDGVTETAWQHLWLSEGFATYMTHLYMEDKYGQDTLKSGMADDRGKVIAFARRRQTPVVDTAVKDNFKQLLNPNSYQKGGWVLHMLRRKLTDSLFWKGIREYVETYGGSNASTDEFRRVMEKASGQELGAFFKQWLYTPGFPDLQVSWTYDDAARALNLRIEQTQDAVFAFPLEYTIGNDTTIHTVNVHEKTTQVRLPLAARPDGIKIDPNVNVLAQIQVTKE